jgi:O-antigen/teichoic acid export membrane protein
VIKNVLSNWTGLVVAGALSFLLTPVMIHHLGVVYYGMWILAASLLDYYGLIDVAMRTALFRFVARSKGANQREALADTISTALAIAAATGLVLLALIPLFAVILPRFFSLTTSNIYLFRWALTFVAVSLSVTIPARVLGSYLCGLGRFDLYNLSGIITVCTRGFLFLLVLQRGGGIIAIAAVTFGTALLSLLLNWRLFRYVEPDISVSWHHANWARAKQLAGFGSYAFVNLGGESLRSYTDAVVIARVLTVALVTPFSVATRLVDYFQLVMSAIGAPLLTAMSELSTRSGELKEFFLRSTKYTALISMFIASLFLFEGKALIRIWVGPGFLTSYPIVLILTAGYVVSFAQFPSQMAAFALARHRALAFLTLAEGVANLLLSIHWAHKYGLIGVALGTMIPLLISKICIQPWYALHILRIPGWRYISEALWRPVLVCGLYLGVSESGLIPHPDGGLMELVSAVSIHAALFLSLTYLIGLLPSEREFLWRRSKQAAIGFRLVRAD